MLIGDGPTGIGADNRTTRAIALMAQARLYGLVNGIQSWLADPARKPLPRALARKIIAFSYGFSGSKTDWGFLLQAASGFDPGVVAQEVLSESRMGPLSRKLDSEKVAFMVGEKDPMSDFCLIKQATGITPWSVEKTGHLGMRSHPQIWAREIMAILELILKA